MYLHYLYDCIYPTHCFGTCYVSIKIITRTQTTASKFLSSIKKLGVDWMNNGSCDAKTPNL